MQLPERRESGESDKSFIDVLDCRDILEFLGLKKHKGYEKEFFDFCGFDCADGADHCDALLDVLHGGRIVPDVLGSVEIEFLTQ